MSDVAEIPMLAILAKMPMSVPLDRESRHRLFSVMAENDFAPLRQILDGDAWRPLDPAFVSRALDEPEVDLGCSDGAASAVEATLMATDYLTTAVVFVPADRFPVDGPERARRTLERMLAAMPPAAHGSVRIAHLANPLEIEAGQFHEEAGLRALDGPFADFVWLLALPPDEYNAYYERDVLLRAPVDVQEHDGRMWIQFYSAPFDYDRPEALEVIRRARDYLGEHQCND